MGKVIVIGHKNPDTDTIISSIVGAQYCKDVLKQDAVFFRAGNINNETKFILDKFKVKAPALLRKIGVEDSVVLVDHNEMSQLADFLDFSQVERIIDHHKLQLVTDRPIAVRCEIVGSTSTLLAMMFQEAGKKISPTASKLLLSGILSDTLNLNGPTTTIKDRRIVKDLNKIAKLKLNEFAAEMFAAKSSLKGISVEAVVEGDCKLFEMGKNKVGISVWETADPKSVEVQKKKIMDFLKSKKSAEKLDYMFFFVVDILKQNSQLYFFDEAEKRVAEKMFKVKGGEDEAYLPGIVSRKKQIVPLLTKELAG